MRNNLKIAVISVIGLLTLTVISAMTINSVPVVNAKNNCGDNCRGEAYGNLISDEAQKSDSHKGYGEEVSPLAKNGGMGEFRESGVGARDNNGDGPGESDEDHGNDD